MICHHDGDRKGCNVKTSMEDRGKSHDWVINKLKRCVGMSFIMCVEHV